MSKIFDFNLKMKELMMKNLVNNKRKLFSIKKGFITLLSVLSFTFSSQIIAATLDEDVQQLSDNWAHVNFELNDDIQEEAFVNLIEQANKLTSSYPEKAKVWAWSGIIKSSFAGASGGLGALSFAKDAKKDFEKAIELNPKALAGSAFTSLGVLYHKVPGWPIAFGDDDDAEVLLKKGLENNPHGKISNFFYGEFLFDERKYHQAKKHLLVAKQVPLRVNSLLADKYRQAEIELLLAQVEKKIAKSTKR